jgi:hypothetical protein
MRPPADPYETGPLEIDPLGAVLAGMLRTPGVRAARAVDGRRGLVVAAVGATGGDDVAALVQLARAAVPVALPGDGLDDVVVTTRRSVHVLRECGVPGTFLHLRLDRERGDVGAARRALRAAGLQRAVRAWLDDSAVRPPAPLPPVAFQPDASDPAAWQPFVSRPVASETMAAQPSAGRPETVQPETAQPLAAQPPLPAEEWPAQPVTVEPVPEPGRPVPPAAVATSGHALVRSAVPRPRHPPVPPSVDRQPALVTLAGVRPRASAGALAVLALQEVDPRAHLDLPLPRREPSPRPVAVGPAGDAVLKQAWARDMDALQRVLAGLRRLP